MTTPSFAQYLSNRLEKSGEQVMALSHVVTGGEAAGELRCETTYRSPWRDCRRGDGNRRCGTSLSANARSSRECISAAAATFGRDVDPTTQEPMTIEPGAVGELVYTHLTREAMPLVRFLGGDIVRIEGGSCGCGVDLSACASSAARRHVHRARRQRLSVAILASSASSSAGNGSPRVVREGSAVSIEPPVPVEVEVSNGHESDSGLPGDREGRCGPR